MDSFSINFVSDVSPKEILANLNIVWGEPFALCLTSLMSRSNQVIKDIYIFFLSDTPPSNKMLI